MSIRIVLNDQGDLALKAALAKLKAHNPKLCKFQNALVSQAIVDLGEALNDSKMKMLAEKLLSRPSKRKMIFDKIGTLVQKLDDEAFQSLENGLKKVCNQFEKVDTPSKAGAE